LNRFKIFKIYFIRLKQLCNQFFGIINQKSEKNALTGKIIFKKFLFDSLVKKAWI